MHFATDHPWERTKNWHDYVAWDRMALSLSNAVPAARALIAK